MNNEIPFMHDPGNTHFPQHHAGPQLTEYTGNRIASALERIADAIEKAAEKRPHIGMWAAESRQPPYAQGDPAPFDPTKPRQQRNDWMST